VDPTAVSISQIQGTGSPSPLGGEHVTTECVVTAVYATGGLGGDVIQTGGTGGEQDVSSHEGSTAVFVYSPETGGDVAIGVSVSVTGAVGEHCAPPQLPVGAGDLAQLVATLEPVEPATIASGFPTVEAQRESLEHMSNLPGEDDLTVADVYGTNQF